MLKRKEECDTYLTHVCRHLHSVEKTVKSDTSTADESHSVGYRLWVSYVFTVILLHYADVYRHESSKCHTLLPFLTYFFKRERILPSIKIIDIKSFTKKFSDNFYGYTIT